MHNAARLKDILEQADTASKPIANDRHVAVAQDIQLSNTEPKPVRYAVFLLSIITILMTVRYLVWRVTVNNWHFWWLSVPLLIAELFTALHILGYQYTIWPRKEPTLALTVDIQYLPIFIFIPTVNEGTEILGPTIEGAKAARNRYLERHPEAQVKIVVCNDGLVAHVPDWQSVEELADLHGVDCITRTQPGGAKAGNIENARRIFGATGKCLIAVLDADQVARPEFLLRTVAPFGDRTIGWVQTRQHYRNDECAVSRWAEHQASLFYDLVCPGKCAINSSYICGTNVIIRAQVLDEIGGFPTESVTEDFAASIRTHQHWRSLYIKDTLAEGIGPLDLTGYFGQQSRWARGTVGVLRSDWRRVFWPSEDGLSFGQRVQYFLSGTHYLCGVRDLIFLVTALTSLYLSDSPIKPVPMLTIAFFLLPYIFSSQLLILLQVRSLATASGASIGYISFPILVTSCFEAFINKRMKFLVTPKLDSGHSDLRSVLPHIFIVLICATVIAHAFVTGHALSRVDLIPLIWVVYALCLISPIFVLAKFTARKPT
jgi:cellulose synthase/poly-beta-1,6-N-acetylglucosamine synthase-like glycosyltransferase